MSEPNEVTLETVYGVVSEAFDRLERIEERLEDLKTMIEILEERVANQSLPGPDYGIEEY